MYRHNFKNYNIIVSRELKIFEQFIADTVKQIHWKDDCTPFTFLKSEQWESNWQTDESALNGENHKYVVSLKEGLKFPSFTAPNVLKSSLR